MKNTSQNKKSINKFFIAFLIVALAFLAVGIGTLGSFYGTGDAYELRVKQESDTETPHVDFYLSDLTETAKDGTTKTVNLRLVDVYVNVAAIYAEEGTPATLRVERSMSGTSFSSPLNAVFENFYTPEPVTDEDGKTTSVATPDVTNGFFSYVAPFEFPADGWRVSSYHYVRLSINGGNANVLINEVVFKGEKLDSNFEGTGKFCVIPARIHAATHSASETAEQARARAEALLDKQYMPSDMQSSFNRFGKEEIYTLRTITEMRLGNTYAADKYGEAMDVYLIDSVYGALGHDILALGTLMFGMSPFGLRFFPMLAAYGALVVLSRLVTRLTKSEKAGFVFALIYALSCLTFGYGHIGTPLFIGVFFFACAFDLVHRFYANGIKKTNFVSVLPLLCAGVFGALAMCVNGAFLIPVAGVVGLFIAGMVRQQKAKKYALEQLLAEPDPVPAAEGEETAAVETKERRAGRILAEYRFKNTAAPALFISALAVGTFLFALIGMLPAYFTYLKVFDDPAHPVMNVFTLAWKAFAGGFVGLNAFGSNGNWLVETLFRGQLGSLAAATLLIVNPIALVAGVFGVCYAIGRIVVLARTKEHDKAWRSELRRTVILLAGLVISVVTALAVKSGGSFILLSYIFVFMLAANYFGKKNMTKAERIVSIIGLVLLALCFIEMTFFVFSIPLHAAVVSAILG